MKPGLARQQHVGAGATASAKQFAAGPAGHGHAPHRTFGSPTICTGPARSAAFVIPAKTWRGLASGKAPTLPTPCGDAPGRSG